MMGKKKKKQNQHNFGTKLADWNKLKVLRERLLQRQNNITDDSDDIGKEMKYEIANIRIEKFIESNPLHFLKWSAQYKGLDGKKVTQMPEHDFLNIFPFATELDNDDFKKKFKNTKNTEFPLEWIKKYKFKEENELKYVKVEINDKLTALNNLPDIKFFLPYSFILHAKIKLQSPYFSSDDDEFYLIQNPCLKEKAFKVPMIRGAGWKGAIAGAGKDLINENLENGDNVRDYIQSYLRIFGTGSKEFRELADAMIAYITKGKQIDWKHVLNFLLFELGMKITRQDIKKLKNEDKVNKWLREKIWEDFCGEARELPLFLQVHKGRAIFYPTYFDRLSLEIINPHSRKTRAGKNPVHYEVVPKGTEGILQVVYIPYDGILKSKEKLKSEVEQDIKFLIECIEKTAEKGVGAKTKLGWGRFELSDETICLKEDLQLPTEWKKCQD